MNDLSPFLHGAIIFFGMIHVSCWITALAGLAHSLKNFYNLGLEDCKNPDDNIDTALDALKVSACFFFWPITIIVFSFLKLIDIKNVVTTTYTGFKKAFIAKNRPPPKRNYGKNNGKA